MAKMPVHIHQLVEQQVHTRLLSRILGTLNEISYKLQNPDHEIGSRNFDREEIEGIVDEMREIIQDYFHEQLPTSSD